MHQHSKEMSEQQGQLLVGTKLIYQCPETGITPVPVGSTVTGCPCSAQGGRVLGSLELSAVNLHTKEISTGENCSAFPCLGLGVEVCGSSRSWQWV